MPPVTVPPRRQRTNASPATGTIHRPGVVVLPTADPPLVGVGNSAYQAAPSMLASKKIVPCAVDAGDGLAEGDTDADGLAEPEGETDAEPDGEAEPDGDRLALVEADGLVDAEALADLLDDGLAELDGDLDGEALGDLLGLCDRDADGLTLVEPDGLIDSDADGEAEPDGESDVDWDRLALLDAEPEALPLAEAEPLPRLAMMTWMPRRDIPATSATVPLPVVSAGSTAPVVGEIVPWK